MAELSLIPVHRPTCPRPQTHRPKCERPPQSDAKIYLRTHTHINLHTHTNIYVCTFCATRAFKDLCKAEMISATSSTPHLFHHFLYTTSVSPLLLHHNFFYITSVAPSLFFYTTSVPEHLGGFAAHPLSLTITPNLFVRIRTSKCCKKTYQI